MKLFKVNFRNGIEIKLPAKIILILVKIDSRRDYDWFASASELVRICKLSDFPQDVAILIEAAILNCYANIENSVQMYPEENYNVTFCYNSLIEKTDYAKLRKKYISSILDSIIKYGISIDLKKRHFGKTYEDMCVDWKSRKLHFVYSEQRINDLRQLCQSFSDDFANIIQEAEQRNAFAEDEERERNLASFKRILRNYDYCPDPDQIR